MLHTSRAIFSGSVFVAYLILGSGSGEIALVNKTAKQEMEAFLATVPRPVYPYSVVPGGVYTPAELAAARRSDPVVAKHFEGFGQHTKVVRLKEDMWVYVSYRKGNMVFWSKKRHKVCKGELVITDGTNMARTRCANIITRVFKPPTMLYHEPPQPVMDIPDPPDPGAYGAPAEPVMTALNVPPAYVEPPTQTGARQGQPSYNPPSPFGANFPQFLPFAGAIPAFFLPPTPNPPPPPPNTSPEPATVGLFTCALTCGAWVWFRRRTRSTGTIR